MNDVFVPILLADDDEEDQEFIREALAETRLKNDLFCVKDGEELMDYLKRRGAYSEPGKAPRPGLILLDLNMPRMDGREALKEIKSDPELRSIPVVVMTTSSEERDILQTYDLGVNSYITKPVTFAGLVRVIRAMGEYWLAIVKLPIKQEAIY
jgi:CheY-like chemotaxis protein